MKLKNFLRKPSLSQLEIALNESRKAARRGYEISKRTVSETSEAFQKISESLQATIETQQRKHHGNSQVVDHLRKQFSEIVLSLDELNLKNRNVLEIKKAKLEDFSVTLFGRTMAGKSTLMEILTKGNGSTIGKGAQRTTRDVRTYRWKELTITDVPGIGAFEGADDEALAYEAAAQSDLILFLITDDAPQPVEAQWLARIIQLGKPVLGICNIRVAYKSEEDVFLFLRKRDKFFEPEHLSRIYQQFHQFVDMEIPGRKIPFIPVHLGSKYRSMVSESPQNESLLQASNFAEIEKVILSEVSERGCFYRIKSFIDFSAAQMNDLAVSMMNHSSQNFTEARVLNEKYLSFQTWALFFKKDADTRIETFVTSMADRLHEEKNAFVEDHYSDSNADENWNTVVESLKIEKKMIKVQTDIFNDWKNTIDEITREISHEMTYVKNASKDRVIKMSGIDDMKKFWRWANIVVSGGASVGTLLGLISPPGLVIFGFVVVFSIFEWLCESKEEKVSKAKKKLRNSINENISKIEINLSSQLKEWFRVSLMEGQVSKFSSDLQTLTSSLETLGTSQKFLAQSIYSRQSELAEILLDEALSFLASSQYRKSVIKAARLPGVYLGLIVDPDMTFPETLRKQMEECIGEDVLIFNTSSTEKHFLEKALFPARVAELDTDSKTVWISYETLDAELGNRIKLIQQLLNIQILRKVTL